MTAGMVLVSLHMGILAEESRDTGLTSNASETGDKAGPITGLKMETSGAGYMMFGQVESGYSHGRYKEGPIDHQWLDFYGGQIMLTSNPNSWFTTKIGLEVRSGFPITTTSGIMKETFRIQYRSFLPRAEGIFDWNFGNFCSLLIESGIFQYNFNPEIKNLGNYLYRGIAYPLFLETKLDYPWADLMAIRSQVGFLNNQIKLEGIINSAITHAPFYDFSLGFTASYTTPKKTLEVGVGVCFDRLWSVDDKATDAKSLYGTPGWDSSWTLRGTKLDSRLTFDFKPMIGNPAFFGPEDGKIYGEAAILGLKDYNYFEDPNFNTTLLHRMPVLLGINIPGFKILDLMSFELEWFGNPYANDWWGGLDGNQSPKPFDIKTADSTWADIYKNKDNFKWTIYLKKSISKFDIIGIAANDHIIYDTYNAEAQANTEQSLREPKNWHWYIKLQYNL